MRVNPEKKVKMKDPVGGCTYNRIYQHIKTFAKRGDNYCKDLVYVLQQRIELEKMYAKGLNRLANKVTKASKDIIKNSIFKGWNCIAQEMAYTADLHTTLASAIQEEAVRPISKMLDEHSKRRKSMDNAVEKSSKLVTGNWNQQIQCKKKVMGLTKDREAIFRAVENNKQIVSEKEKNKLQKKLKKSTEMLSKVDQQYYDLNRAGEDIRLKWESVFEQSYQVIHDLEKEKIKLLSNILNKYSQHINCFGRTLIERQMQIHQVVQNVSVDEDIQSLLDNASILSDENKIGFLLTDYYEEDGRNSMDEGRRKTGLSLKIQRLQEDIDKLKKGQQGLEKMVRTSFRNPSFSDSKPDEATASMRDESTLKLTLLEVNLYKLTSSVAELEGNSKPFHPLSDNITNWKDKEYYHNLVQISRPVKMKTVHQRSLTDTIFLDNSNDHHGPDPQQISEPIYANQTINSHHTKIRIKQSETTAGSADYATVDNPGQEIGTCKALYDYEAARDDELNMQQGDILIIYKKDVTGWWMGSLRGRKGIFPATYVEELPQKEKGTSEA
ncbi:nostrin isoform X1 [Hemitrygon akajei]|uniref:nostrin isoform X1 n=1 Tax=Hemitrygon akajei TaxID=2704970 RepID=UPI003BF98BAE